MKNRLKLFHLLIFYIFLVFVTIILADTLVVKVKSTSLRNQPVFYASSVTILSAGESVEKLAEKEGWYRVRTSKGLEGWLHSSAVQAKKFSLMTLGKAVKTEATADEVALASKGFNQQVEAKYKASNPEVSYAWVDRMLRIQVTPAQLKKFFEEGKLGEFGGAK